MQADINPKNSGRWVLLATILGSSLTFIDGTVVNVALPVLQSKLDANVTDVQWVIEGYALMLASLILVGGSLGDKFGRKKLFSIGVVIFTIASAWCGFSRSVDELIFGRLFQGVGGDILIPGSLAILSSNFGAGEKGKAIGTWSSFSAITAALGPLLGGWLIDNFSWRWIFFINLPIAVIVLLITFFKVEESKNNEDNQSLDLLGSFLVTIGLGLLVYGLIESSELGLTNFLVMGLISVGALVLFLFLIVESKLESPMMPLSLFESKTFSGANILTFFIYSALSGALFFFPFNLIQVQGYTATEAGASLLPLIISISLLSRWSGGLMDKYGAKLPLVFGSLIVAVGYFMLIIPEVGGSYWTTFFPGILTLGIGMGIIVAPLTTAVMGSVGEGHSGLASGVNNAIARTAGLIAIAVIGIVVMNIFSHDLDKNLGSIYLTDKEISHIESGKIDLAAMDIPESVDATTASFIKGAISDSFVSAFQVAMLISVILALAGSATAYFSMSSKSKLFE